MGTGNCTEKMEKRHHHNPPTEAVGSSPFPSFSVLRNALPKTGTIYPPNNCFMKRDRHEFYVEKALIQATTDGRLTIVGINDVFTNLFKEALNALLDENVHKYQSNLIKSIQSLKKQLTIHAWTRRLDFNHFTWLFLTLRASRLR